MEQQDRQYTEDDAMKVLLNPDAYRKYKAEQGKVELPDEVKDDIEKQMSNPLRYSDSEIL